MERLCQPPSDTALVSIVNMRVARRPSARNMSNEMRLTVRRIFHWKIRFTVRHIIEGVCSVNGWNDPRGTAEDRERDRWSNDAFFLLLRHRNTIGGVLMVSMEQLEKMKFATLDSEGADTLTDISKVTIHGESALERMESFLQQVNNPYHFKVGNTPVRITFSQNGAPLEEMLKTHFLSLKQKS